MMEALQILKFSIKTDGGLDFTAGLSSADELQQLEAVLEDEVLVPSELNAFIRSLEQYEEIIDVADQ